MQEGRAIDLCYLKAFYSDVSSAAPRAKTSPGTNQAFENRGATPIFIRPDNTDKPMEIIPVLIPETPSPTTVNQFIDSPSCCKTNSVGQPAVGEAF